MPQRIDLGLYITTAGSNLILIFGGVHYNYLPAGLFVTDPFLALIPTDSSSGSIAGFFLLYSTASLANPVIIGRFALIAPTCACNVRNCRALEMNSQKNRIEATALIATSQSRTVVNELF